MQGTKYKTTHTSRFNRRKQTKQQSLPTIPDKRYFAIGEVALLCNVKPHVLRYWEQEFQQLSPVKRRGNRRYYQYNDILLVRQIRQLLYDNGFTIEGARTQLAFNPIEVSRAVETDAVLKKLIVDLEDVLKKLKTKEME
jgi:DNA-binding transcriptional MerR regulator